MDRRTYVEVEQAVWEGALDLLGTWPDWLPLGHPGPPGYVEGAAVEADAAGCRMVNADGSATELEQPFSDALRSEWETGAELRTVADVEALLPSPPAHVAPGPEHELARRLLTKWGDRYLLYCAGTSPFFAPYSFLGFAGMLTALLERPQVFQRICEWSLEWQVACLRPLAEIGVPCAFVDESWASADVISPDQFARFAYPFERDLCAALREMGFLVVFYFCGAIEDRLEWLGRLPAHALAFEESKKNWRVDIGEVRRQLGPERCLFGNVDVCLLRDADRAALAREVARQAAAAGPAAFVTSIGSPATLDTAPEKLGWLVEASHALAG